MFKQLAIFLIAQSILTQPCIRGCLRCENESLTSTNKICTLCDHKNRYYLKGTDCVSADQQNCTMILSDGTCSQCSPDYFIDPNTGKCVLLTTDQKVPYCTYHSSPNICSKCQVNYMIFGKKCISITNPIANCLVQSTQDFCVTCQNNYYLTQDQKTCNKYLEISSCYSYSPIKCMSCKTDYYLNKNYYFELHYLFTNSEQRNFINNQISDQIDGIKSLEYNKICKKATITNCKTFEDFDKCTVCNIGYYLTIEKKCEKYQIQPLENCEVYSTQTTCAGCIQGFYLKSNTECVSITTIANCSKYSTTSSSTICSICESNFYLSGNSCASRTLVDNCGEYELSLNRCKTCSNGYVSSTDGLKCLAVVSNCLTHNSFSSTETTTKCSICQDKYFLSGLTCVSGSKQNCNKYQTNSDVCTKCTNQYYSVPDCLTQQTTITECKTYGVTAVKECALCNDFFKTIYTKQICENKTEIANCKTYSTDRLTCTFCADNYYLATSTTCTLIGNNCKIATDTTPVCTQCQSGYALGTKSDDSKQCFIPYDYLTQQCASVTNYGESNIDNFTCDVCKTNAFNYSDNFQCIETAKLPFISFKNIQQIDNCKAYVNSAAGNVICWLCEKNYFLALDKKSCVANRCQGNTTTKTKIEAMILNLTDIITLNVNYCPIPTTTTNDWVQGMCMITGINNILTLSCQDYVTLVNTVSTATNFSNINPNSTDNENWVNDPFDIFLEVSCPLWTNTDKINNSVQTTKPDQVSCKYYYEHGTAGSKDYRCLNCGDNQVSTVHADGYLNNCQNMTDCSGNKYKNIHSHWAKFLTCHECTDPKKIPILAYNTNGDNLEFTGFQKFYIGQQNWSPTSTNETLNIFCLDVSSIENIKTGLSIISSNNNVQKLPDNCAFGILDLTKSGGSFNNANLTGSLVCGTCKPGYYQTDQSLAIKSSCTKIENCDTVNNNYFNICGQCKTGFAYNFTTDIRFYECVAVPSTLTNCLAYKSTSNECYFCKKGYVLNQDKFCEQITGLNCQHNFSQPNLNRRFYTYNFYSNFGCLRCNTNFVSVFLTSNDKKNICALSDYISPQKSSYSAPTNNATTLYYNKCIQYKLDKKCAACQTGYIIHYQGSGCLSNLLIPNCKLATDSQNCNTCENGYGLVNENSRTVCVKNEKTNCDTYNINDAQEEVKCSKCKDEFYLEENKCKTGFIANCLVYYNSNNCTKCKEGFWLFLPTDTSTSANYCIPQNPDLNCLIPYFQVGATNLEINCKTCTKANGLQKTVDSNSTTIQQSYCYALNKIKNCKTIQTTVTLILNTFNFICTECDSTFYITNSGNTCSERKNISSNCNTYYLDKDLCTTCKTGFYKSTDEKTCIQNPDGIMTCLTYSAKNTCTSCGANRYLSTSTCILVPVASRLSNCIYYENATTCSGCDTNYFLSSGKCILVTINNCKEFLAVDSCKKCNDNFVIVTANGKNTCLEKIFLNCLEVDQIAQKCTLCKQNYFVNSNGECEAVIPISGCLIQESKTTCTKCDSNKALSTDKKKCDDKMNFDENCEVQIKPDGWDCSKCQSGFYFKDGSCQAFNQSTFTRGCFMGDVKNQALCLFCTSGYYMDTNGKCQSYITETTNTTTSGLKLILERIMLIFVILLFQL